MNTDKNDSATQVPFSCSDLLATLRDCEEVLIFGNPIDRLDAKESRFMVTITGPTPLLAPLMDALTVNKE